MKITGLMRALMPELIIVLAIGIFAVQASAQSNQGQMGNMQEGQMNMAYDLHYIDMMVMHHQQGMEMSQLAVTKAQNAQVKAFARKSVTGQQRDIDELKKYRDQFYAGQPQMDMSNMQGMGMDMHKEMEATMNRLRAATGTAFDRAFLDSMISHHQMATDMSKEATTQAEHEEIKNFARKTGAMQWGEIADMNKMKTSLGGAGTTKTPTRRPQAKKPAPKKKSTGGHVH